MVKRADLWTIVNRYHDRGFDARSIVDPNHLVHVSPVAHNPDIWEWVHRYVDENHEVEIQRSEGYYSPKEALDAAARIIVIPKWRKEYQLKVGGTGQRNPK